MKAKCKSKHTTSPRFLSGRNYAVNAYLTQNHGPCVLFDKIYLHLHSLQRNGKAKCIHDCAVRRQSSPGHAPTLTRFNGIIGCQNLLQQNLPLTISQTLVDLIIFKGETYNHTRLHEKCIEVLHFQLHHQVFALLSQVQRHCLAWRSHVLLKLLLVCVLVALFLSEAGQKISWFDLK